MDEGFFIPTTYFINIQKAEIQAYSFISSFQWKWGYSLASSYKEKQYPPSSFPDGIFQFWQLASTS